MEEEKKDVKTEETQEKKAEGTPETPPVEQKTATTEEKETFGKKVKRHWKGLAAGIAGGALLIGSAIAAYRRGKAASAVPEQPEDYSLNPNE